MSRRDPVERAADDTRDLYDVATWERRSLLDRLSSLVYALLVWGGRTAIVAVAAILLTLQFVASGLTSRVVDPTLLLLVVLSVVPALALAAYVRRADVTTPEPLWLLVVTYILGVLFAMFATVGNSVAFEALRELDVAALGVLLLPVLFYLVVGPVEETVKLLAVRLVAYRSATFDSVVDGAVYGAVAGLGFASIENLLYISRSLGDGGEVALLGVTGGTAALRALAGPGHVIYSAIAGYYLGLAKFNRRNRGPIVVKGLLIAAFVHGTYNTLVGVVPALANRLVFPLGEVAWFVAFIVVYDGLLGYFLYRKLRRYAVAFRSVRGGDLDGDVAPELTEFDRGVRPLAADGPGEQANPETAGKTDASDEGDFPGGGGDGSPPRGGDDSSPRGDDDSVPRGGDDSSPRDGAASRQDGGD
jgi:RsiW-degrading membrane proteinase PrsW (M82 family)